MLRQIVVFGSIGTVLLLGVSPSPRHAGVADPPLMVGKVDLAIGATDDVGEAYWFTDIRGLTLDSQQRIIVADNQTNNVRVYSATGVHLYTFGRTGQGPGDLIQPCCIAIAADGRLWVKEFGNHRYSSFRLGNDRATYEHSIRSGSNPSGYLDRVAWDPQGHLVDVLSASGLGSGFVRAFLDSSGAVVRRDTLREPPKDSLAIFDFEKCTPAGCGSSRYNQPYGATSLRAFGPNGEEAMAVSSRYAVLWLDARGNRIALLRQPGEGPTLSDREKAIAERTMDAIAKNTGKSRGSLPFTIPDHKSPLRAIGFDLDGRLWVERAVADGKPRRADVYNHRGQWVAIMEWPSDVRLTSWAVQGAIGLGVEVDSLGTNRVVRLRFR